MEKLKERKRDSETIQHAAKKRWSGDARSIQSQIMKDRWDNPDEAKKLHKGVENRWNSPQSHQQHSKKMRQQWQDPTYSKKIRSHHTGKTRSPETRRRIGEKKKEQFEDDVQREKISIAKGGSFVKAYPHLLRGASIPQIMMIEDLTYKQVEGVQSRMRAAGKLPKPTTEESNEAKRRAQLGKGELSEQQKQIYKLVKELLKAKRIAPTTEDWDALRVLYQQFALELPENYPDVLRMEYYLSVIKKAFSGDTTELLLYKKLSQEIEEGKTPQQLVFHETFIAQLYWKPKIGQIAEQYRNFLYTAAYWVVGRHADAEDIVQEVFMRLLEQHDFTGFPFGDNKKEKKYLNAVVKNAARDFIRKRHAGKRDRRREEVFDKDIPSHNPKVASAEHVVVTRLDLERIAAVAVTTEAGRGVLSQAAGYDPTEQARTQGKNPGTLRKDSQRWRERNLKGVA